MNIKNTYNEESIVTLDYREAVKQSLGMYIGSNDSNGMHHLLTEIVANAMDEAAAGYGKKVQVVIDRSDNSACVIDNGRGIPFHKKEDGNYAIVEMCTNLHSGGKFEGQGNYKSSLGLHGVGATVTNALSSDFIIEVWRDKEHCFFEVYEGDAMDPDIEPYSGPRQGSMVKFIPDKSVFGDIKWDVVKIQEELQLHALLNNGITFELIEEDTPNKLIGNWKYYYTNGIKDMLKIKAAEEKLLTNPIYSSVNVTADTGETCLVEMAFAYCEKSYEQIFSFVNGGYTPNDGTHVTGWKTAYTSLINKLARENEILKEKDKNLSGEIIRKGLFLILSIKMDCRPMFAEQTKRTLNSPVARTFCSRAVGQLQLQPKEVKQILDKIMLEQKAEEAAQRKREAQEKIARGGKSMNSLKDLPEKLADANDFTDAEIFFCEGDSAAGNAKITKALNQAIMPLRGKVLNTTCKELADAIKSETIKDILTCLGCGIGDHFNINNLRYNRIIFLCDADPDGGHINLLLTTLFLHHLPELITAGKVFAAVPPLYRTINGKEIKYWVPAQEKEYKKYMRNHKNAQAQRIKGLGEMNPDELYSTTMDPANRTLIPLTTENMQATLALYDRLMGKQPSLRKEFILKNKLSRIDDDDSFDGYEDDE